MTANKALAKAALEELATELWSTARAMEAKGEAECVGLSKMEPEDFQRAMARSSSYFAQSTGLERAAWMALAKSGFGEPVAGNFFDQNKTA